MAETAPIHIPLSTHQQARFSGFESEITAIVARKNEAVTMLIASVADPVGLAQAGWSFRLDADGITCTPPAPAHPPLALEA